VNPDDIIEAYGADTLRLYEMFIGDYEKAAPWNAAGIKGCRHFLERYWNLQNIIEEKNFVREELSSNFHKTIKKVTEDIEALKFNTAIAALMALINEIYTLGSITKEELKIFTLLLYPFAPHITEEVWHSVAGDEACLGLKGKWPAYDEGKCKDDFIEIALQVNGKIQSRKVIAASLEANEAICLAKRDEKVVQAIAEKNIIKEIYVKGRLVNIVVK
jgi:leucyl-tRNA synthetase